MTDVEYLVSPAQLPESVGRLRPCSSHTSTVLYKQVGVITPRNVNAGKA